MQLKNVLCVLVLSLAAILLQMAQSFAQLFAVLLDAVDSI